MPRAYGRVAGEPGFPGNGFAHAGTLTKPSARVNKEESDASFWGVRQSSSFGRGVPPGRPDASARRPYHVYEEFFLTPFILALRVWALVYERFVDAVGLEFGVDGLGEGGFLEADHFGSLEGEMFLQVRRGVMLHDRVMPEGVEHFLAAVFGNVAGDEDEMELALGAPDGFAADQQKARS